MIYSLSGSFVNAFVLKRVLDAESEWHQGTDTIAAALEQVALLGILFAQVTHCSKYWKWNPLPSISPTLLLIIRFSPLIFGLGIEAVSKEKHPNIHFIGKTLSYNIGRCIKVAFAIVTLSTIKSYPSLFVSSSMGYLVAVYIDDVISIPYAIRQTTNKVLRISSWINLVMYSPTRIDRAIEIFSLVLGLLSEFECQPISDLCFGRFSPEVKEGGDEIYLKTIGQVRTVVNPHHLKHSQFQSTLDQIDPKKLKSIIDRFRSELGTIDFGPYKKQIEQNLLHDDHFNSAEWTTDKKLGREIDFMKEGALIFLYRLERAYASMVTYPDEPSSPIPSIEVRKPLINDLNIEKKQLAYLLDWIQEVDQKTQHGCKDQRALFLINIGIHGANYCLARLQQLPKLMEGFSRRQDPELKPALYYLLREKQNNLIVSYKKCYHQATRVFGRFLNSVSSQIEGEETPHEFNRFLYLFGVPLGLNIDAAIADRTLFKRTITLERYLRFPLVRVANKCFYEKHYTEGNIIGWVRAAINEGRINSHKFIEWMGDQKGYDVDLILDEEEKISDDAIRYFLLAHGVLGVVKD